MRERNNDILVEVNGVGKKFSRNIRRSLIYGFSDVLKALFGMGRQQRSTLRPTEFWAVREVSFKLRRGECLGLIGHNGAGKSTLLKMLNGLVRPDEGEIIMRGRVSALIELGTGFNPILTGRENIYVNGQILGFTKAEIDSKLEAIIEFAEIGDFIDSPVQSYSSGMKVRLGFAVAAQMEPDVLIIDEVLAVGDVGFRGKCMKVIGEMMSRAAVIFVSHSMPIVNRYCTRGILMSKGVIEIDAPNVQDAIDRYLNSFSAEKLGQKFESGQVSLDSFLCNEDDLIKSVPELELFSTVKFQINFRLNDSHLDKACVRLNFIDRNLVVVASVVSDYCESRNNNFEFRLAVGPFNIQPGLYKVSIILFGTGMNDPLLIHEALYSVNVIGNNKDYGGNPVVFNAQSY